MLSFAGIPPFAGFFTKFYRLLAVYQKYSSLLIVSLILCLLASSGILLYVYLRLIINILRINKKSVITVSNTIAPYNLSNNLKFLFNNCLILIYILFILFVLIFYFYLIVTDYATDNLISSAHILLYTSESS